MSVATLCPFCGQPVVLDLHEVWGPDFMLDTCCPRLYDHAVDWFQDSPTDAAAWLSAAPLVAALGASFGSPRGLRRVVEEGACLRLDWHPRQVPVSFAQACSFVERHHRHVGRPTGWRFGAGLRNGPDLVAVVMVGRPVARAFDPRAVVEVTRMCAEDGPRSWNACSQLLGWAAQESRRRGFARIVTYTREDESGASLKAAGWKIDGRVRGRSWSCSSRPRKSGEFIDKLRWTRDLIR